MLHQKSTYAILGQSLSTKEASILTFLGPESSSSEHKSSKIYDEIFSHCL
jgi:hypothetical protein